MTPVCLGNAVRGPGLMQPRVQLGILACTCVGMTAFVFAVDPGQHAVYPTCPFHQATGIYCAGCGATRALYALLHGRLLEAAHDNVLLVGALPFFLMLAALYAARVWRENAWPRVTLEPRTVLMRALLIFAVLMAFMVLRNLPGWPFAEFRPV